MARQTKQKIRPPKPQLRAQAPTPLDESAYPAARAMSSGVVAAVAKNDVRKTLTESIKSGLIQVDIKTDQIDSKAVASDRMDGWESDEDFNHLLQNIEERGQMQPVVVRPERDDWAPSENTPLSIREADRFVLLSGRRRYLACSKLGIPVKALIRSNPDELDIEERFFENTVRRSLTQLELHISIGQIAEARGKSVTQAELAKMLGVTQPVVSRSQKVLRYIDELLELHPDANMMSRIEIYDALAEIEGGSNSAAETTHENDTQEIDSEEEDGSQISSGDDIVTDEASAPVIEKPKVQGSSVVLLKRPSFSGRLVRGKTKSRLKLALDLPAGISDEEAAELADKINELLA